MTSSPPLSEKVDAAKAGLLLTQAEKEFNSQQYYLALIHYTEAVQSYPHIAEEVADVVCIILTALVQMSSAIPRMSLKQHLLLWLQLVPMHKGIRNALFLYCYHKHDYFDGFLLARTARRNFSKCEQTVENMRNLCNACIERWHFRMMNDVARNSAYEAALQTAIQNSPEGIVLDVGAGCGLLSWLAIKHGCRKVVACEMNKVRMRPTKQLMQICHRLSLEFAMKA